MSDVVARWASRIILAAAPLAVALLMSMAACDERPAMHNGGGYEICALGTRRMHLLGNRGSRRHVPSGILAVRVKQQADLTPTGCTGEQIPGCRLTAEH